jgi:hypothetical protein
VKEEEKSARVVNGGLKLDRTRGVSGGPLQKQLVHRLTRAVKLDDPFRELEQVLQIRECCPWGTLTTLFSSWSWNVGGVAI